MIWSRRLLLVASALIGWAMGVGGVAAPALGAPIASSLGSYGDEELLAVQDTLDGGQIVVGWTDSAGAGDRDAWVVKLDADGDPEWQRAFGGPDRDEAHSVEVSGGGLQLPGYLVVGLTESFGAGGEDIWALRLDESGDVLWEKTYGGTGADAASMVAGERLCFAPGEERPADWAIAGTTNSFGAGDFDAWVLRLDDVTGDLLWSRTYGSAAFAERAHSIAATPCGEWIIASDTAGFDALNGDFWVLKVDDLGAVEWEKRYGGADLEARPHVVQTDDDDDGIADDGYLVAGLSESWGVAGLGQDVWAVKLDATGAITWQLAFGSTSREVVSGVGEKSNELFVAGSSIDDILLPSEGEGFFVGLDPAGSINWARSFDGPDPSTFDSVDGLARLRGGVERSLVGATESFSLRGLDGWVLRTDDLGEISGCAAQGDWSYSSAATTGTSADTTAVVTEPIGVSIASHAETVTETNVTARDGCNIDLSATVLLPKTGQTTSFDVGNADDGALEIGVPWPSPRFVPNGDGSVTDALTGLVWLLDANCAGSLGYDPDATGDGRLSQDNALAFVDDFNTGVVDPTGCDYTGGETDWRLPNVIELESLANLEEPVQADWLVGQGFTRVEAERYWSSTPFAQQVVTSAVFVSFADATHDSSARTATYLAWPVRGGSTGPPVAARSNLWKESATPISSADPGVFWPEPRFFVHGDGTVTDRLTGLMWIQDFECLGVGDWQTALDTIADFNLATPSGSYPCTDYVQGTYPDWRLPNRKEVLSLIDYAVMRPALPPGHPFLGAAPGTAGAFWTSSVDVSGIDRAWAHQFTAGRLFSAVLSFPSARPLAVRTPAPEPGLVPLLMVGVAGLGLGARRGRTGPRSGCGSPPPKAGIPRCPLNARSSRFPPP